MVGTCAGMGTGKGKGTGTGKKKIEIARILEKPRSRVTYSKRRKGLFKKASELDVLCGSDTAIVSVSDAGNVFTAGRPSLVLHALLLGGGLELDYAHLDAMGPEELATLFARIHKAKLEMERLVSERRRTSTNSSGNAQAAPAPEIPPPALTNPSSELAVVVLDEEGEGCSALLPAGCSGVADDSTASGLFDPGDFPLNSEADGLCLSEEEISALLHTPPPPGAGDCASCDFDMTELFDLEEFPPLPLLPPPGAGDCASSSSVDLDMMTQDEDGFNVVDFHGCSWEDEEVFYKKLFS